MKRVLVDTNAFVSFITDRNAEQQMQTSALLERAARREVEILLHQAVIGEFAYVLLNSYRLDPQEVARLLRDLLLLPGADVVDEISWVRVLDLWPSQVPDFGDAILAAVALTMRVDAVATFDKRFIRQLGNLGVEVVWA